MPASVPPVPDVADFLGHIKRDLAFAHSPFSPTVRRPYTPAHVLRSYLNRGRIKALLRCFCRLEGDWETIQNDYLAVFSTLIVIKRGTYITHFIQSHNLSDSYLPFRHREDWPHDCLEFFEDFEQAQWQFCAEHLQKQRLSGVRYPDEIIIPIVSCVLLKDGVDSQTYKIEVDPSYNFLVGKDESGAPTTNTFVLKTCRAKDAKYHHNEVEAYKVLMYQTDISQHIAKFYGSWVQFERYNMILEYVEGGTLENFFQTVEPPMSEQDIIKFWSNLLDIIKVVQRIHEIPSANNKQEHLQGIHHDIKPANILVSRPHGPSSFDVTFKLADLGLTTFEVKTKKGEPIEVRDGQGTQMYTAPEYCRDDSFLEQSILRAKPSKDIWSLGCVYSEAAVWSVFGKDRLAAYLGQRRAATEVIPGLRDSAYSGCFHGGQQVLQEVIDMHIRVRKDCRRNDYIVGEIIVLIEDMLEEVASRPNAVEVYRRSRKTIDKFRKTWENKSNEDALDDIYPRPFRDTSLDTAAFVTRTTPPVQPKEPPSFFRNGSHTIDLGISLSQSPQALSGFIPPNGHPGSSVTSPVSHSNSRHEIESRHLSSSSKNFSFRDSNTSGFSDGYKHNSYGSSSIPNRQSRPISHQPLDEDDPSPPSSGNCCDSGECASQSNSPVGKGKAKMKDPLDPKQSVVPNGTHAVKFKTELDFPKVCVNDVLSWHASMKNAKGIFKNRRSTVTPLEGHQYLERLQGRDQVFLVDDSATMYNHWEDVKLVVKALGYLVKESDPDGMDLYFTNSSRDEHCGDTSSLMKAFSSVTPGNNKCDMKRALGMILEKYHPEKMKEPKEKRISLPGSKKMKKKRLKRGVNIYVLTDGVWQERPLPLCGVEEPIKIMVDKLKARGLLASHVGIQFISFGSDRIGITRLKRLDSKLKEFGITMDIVDHEDCRGNVWKMLLGSFDPHWDADSETDSSAGDFEKG